jgi:prolyl-tRNA editing enzyme YbaK/EbsC (Cys-tRNA(Pro) deacylase)
MFEKAKNYLTKYNLENRIIEFETSTATVSLAAAALGITEGEIAKTMAFMVGEEAILVVVAGDKRIDNAKFKNHFHVKAKMIAYEEVEKIIGHAGGGVCPFGINDNIKVYLDETLKVYEYVYPACGNAASAVKLLIKELEVASNYVEWIDICK